MQQSVVSLIVFLYIFIGTALLVYNLLYMLGSSQKNRRLELRIKSETEKQARVIGNVKNADGKYRRKLYRRLKDADKLLIFSSALERNMATMPRDEMIEYLKICHGVICDAAMAYCRRPAMERALFAHLVSILPVEAMSVYRRLGEIFLVYLENSTIYCRENVLKALYRLGKADTLERALQLFEEKGWYHSPKLIADEMAQFNGDVKALAIRLWNRSWSDHMKIVLIQFMNNLSDDLSDLVMPELSSSHYEVSFAAIRYFTRHVREDVAPILREIVRKDGETAIAAARALGNYPSEESKEVLMQALTSRNWYVRYNAAEALKEMDLKAEEIEYLCHHMDQYAREMFIYVWEGREGKEC